MIPTLKIYAEYFASNPPSLAGFHLKDESGKTVGVLSKDDFIDAFESYAITTLNSGKPLMVSLELKESIQNVERFLGGNKH